MNYKILIYTIYAVNSEIIEICVSTSVTKLKKPLHHILCLYLMHNLNFKCISTKKTKYIYYIF